MFNGMMDPELFKLEKERKSRISPEELARMQQQMMSNPDLVKMATESAKNMQTEDFKRVLELMRQTRPEDMAEISDQMANAKPEEIAAIKARYEISVAKSLKQEGNKLHSQGQYREAAHKYNHAKDNVENVPSAAARTLQLQCSLNLMSCYLKTGKFNECITEGTEVLSYESKNVKALYRRGQAYRELGNFEAALVDLKKAYEIKPDDKTIANVLRSFQNYVSNTDPEVLSRLSTQQGMSTDVIKTATAMIKTLKPDELQEMFQVASSLNQTDPLGSNPAPDVRTNMPKISPEMEKMALDIISKMSPENLQRMMSTTSSSLADTDADLQEMWGKMASETMCKMSPEDLERMMMSTASSSLADVDADMPETSPEMVKMASEIISKMSPEDLQRMMSTSSSSLADADADLQEMFGKMTSETISKMSPEDLQRMMSTSSSSLADADADLQEMFGKMASETISKMSPEDLHRMMSTTSSSLTDADADLQEAAHSTMNDPAMRQSVMPK